MWAVLKVYYGGDAWGSSDYEKLFFVTADRDLAATTVDLLNENLKQAKDLYAHPPRIEDHRALSNPAVMNKHMLARKNHDEKIRALFKEYDPRGDVDIDCYKFVEVEVR